MARIVLGEIAAVELGERAGALDTGRAPADHDHVERAVLDEGRVLVRRLPPLEKVLLEAHGVGERVHRKRVLGCALRSEEVDPGPERQDEIVVRERCHLREANLALGQIDGADRVLVHHHVRLLVEQVAQRVPDVGRLEQGGRDLVQERLERAVVALVDQHDLRARVLELARGADAGEPSAEDEYTWHMGCVSRFTQGLL